jgi:hypothetical protein
MIQDPRRFEIIVTLDYYFHKYVDYLDVWITAHDFGIDLGRSIKTDSTLINSLEITGLV